MYDVTVYFNTGYNTSNLPDSPTRLMANKSLTLPSTDIMQNRWLSSITVNTNYQNLENVDYCKIGNMYYVVGAVQMTSPDVAVLALSPDFVTSMGGVNGLDFADGITERYCVKEDNFGEYTEADPLLTCSKPLEIVTGGSFFNYTGNTSPVLIESSIDLNAIADETDAVVFKDTGSEENAVLVPEVPALTPNMKTSCRMKNGEGTENIARLPATAYYRGASQRVAKGMARVRALGLESAIISQYVLPQGYYDSTIYTVNNDLTDDDPEYIALLKGVDVTEETKAPFIYDTDIKNKRVLYGDLNNYTMISVSTGNKAEFSPEDIYDGNTAPSIRMITDPRSSGCPYFRFNSYLNDTTNFYYNAITGNTWQTAPLVWTDKSGTAWSNYQWNTKIKLQEQENREYGISTPFKRMGDVLDVVNPFSYDTEKGSYDITFPNLSQIGTLAVSAGTAKLADFNQDRKMNQLLMDMAQSRTVAPEINFPRTDSLRDFQGNGILVYRTVPSKTDRQKQDKLLTMYGYKDTRPIESWMFTCRKKFNYVKLSDCSIVSKGYPIWMREGAKAQLRGGVRFWHVDVTESAYLDNPIVE